MDQVRNPYVPGAGRRPAALVGRDAERQEWSVALERVERGRSGRSHVLYGLRGVGKTVLLSDFARAARSRGWIVGMGEAGAGKQLRQMLSEALHADLVSLAHPTAGRKLLRALRTLVSFKASYDVGGTWTFGLDLNDVPGGGADTGSLETDLSQLVRDLSAAAGDRSSGLAILIDEAQDLTVEELTAVCATCHLAGQNDWPLLVAMAGLPSLPRMLAEAKSYAEQLFLFSHIQHLSGQLARDAVIEPARPEGVAWEVDAVDCIVQETRGYPYFLQEYGQATWNAADGPEHITFVDAKVGAARALASLDAGFFRSRWDRATSAEKQYLKAMAPDGDGGSSSSKVAERLDRKPTSLGPARAALIHKGLVYPPDHGIVAFTVPGMAAFILRQVDE